MILQPHTRHEVRALTRLAAPILLTNVAWMLVGVVDVVMLGRWSSEAVAAALLAGVWIHLTQVAGMGLVMGIDPLVTQAWGAGDREAMGRAGAAFRTTPPGRATMPSRRRRMCWR